MNKKVFIRQDGTIPGHRIIEELESRGGKATKRYGDVDCICYYLIRMDEILRDYICPNSNYTELLYNKETDSFYEKSPVLSNSSNTGKLLEGEYVIPEGYDAKIESGKVVISKKEWRPKLGESCYSVEMYADVLLYHVTTFDIEEESDLDFYDRGTLFATEPEAQVLCDKLNDAIKTIRKEVEK